MMYNPMNLILYGIRTTTESLGYSKPPQDDNKIKAMLYTGIIIAVFYLMYSFLK